MATYAEMASIVGGGSLRDKLTAAVADQAEVVRLEAGGTANHANRLIWAKTASSDPQAMAVKMMWSAVIQNKAATQAQIIAASDAQLLSAVAAIVDIFATGT